MKGLILILSIILSSLFENSECQFVKDLSFKDFFIQTEAELKSNLNEMNNFDEAKIAYVQKSNIIRVINFSEDRKKMDYLLTKNPNKEI